MKPRLPEVAQINNLSRQQGTSSLLSLDVYSLLWAQTLPDTTEILYSTNVYLKTFIFFGVYLLLLLSLAYATNWQTNTGSWSWHWSCSLEQLSRRIAHLTCFLPGALTDLTTWQWAHQTRKYVYDHNHRGLIISSEDGHLDWGSAPVHTYCLEWRALSLISLSCLSWAWSL